ncbi:CocE/NonD family hydrolase [Saccharopolyspora indica]|uniref:CocE/NonD family hydrolase n=1 Tax=Saccharopolyspora indica TaxID=1229659 RepID=UPI0022EA16D1|nr:CocE/NonD family hydrolase [Saccharopolyspora indica]MDA3647478.1 CocE/NonD family hydrolase [Saccharopolyspora indica]
MRTVEVLPHPVKEEAGWIPLSDGTRLAARIWRPVDSDNEPVPAVLEFIPYRQRDLTARRDSVNHPYLAGFGYACARVDLRGSGDSEGLLTDEYLEQELRDAAEILGWLAEQPWCSGRTGMMGISWGGFNALQVAARRPPSLAAIAVLSCSDDRYADDVHYMGGCLLSDNLSWASTMFAYNSCPPDPATFGPGWRRQWFERLVDCEPWLAEWLRHQHRDDYWRHGSVCEDYGSVGCPVLAVSGWADGYSNAVFRLMQHLDVPRRGLIGPWSHKYPHLGQPGPAIGFLQELVRWWDHWLKDVDNGAMDGPMLRVWMQESMPPSTAYDERPGRWVGEPSWPSPHVERVRFPLGQRLIARPGEAPPSRPLPVESPLSVGQFAGKWCSYNAPPDLPYDQREEDGGSLVFDTAPLAERCEILGGPVAELDLEVDRPTAMVAVRLSDVAPEGRATRVTYGLLNLTHRDGHGEPRPLRPGQRYRVRVQLNGVAQAFPPGHQIRMSLSTSYWPLAWPPPEPVRLTVHPETSALELPIRPVAEPDEVTAPAFGEPEGAPVSATTQLQPGEQRWTVSRDLVGYDSALEVVKDLGVVRFDDIDLAVTRRAYERYSWTADDFDSVRGEIEWTMAFERGDWSVRTTTRTVLTSSRTEFHLHAELDAYEGDQRVFSRNWQQTIPRALV